MTPATSPSWPDVGTSNRCKNPRLKAPSPCTSGMNQSFSHDEEESYDDAGGGGGDDDDDAGGGDDDDDDDDCSCGCGCGG